MNARSEREIGPEAPYNARWDCAALNIVNQIWQIPSDWPETRRKAHAQILIIEALKAADSIPRRALEEILEEVGTSTKANKIASAALSRS